MSISNIIFGGEWSFKPTSTASQLILVHSSTTTIHPQHPQHLPNHAQQPGDEPLPSHEGCGINHQHPGCAEQKAATPAPPLSKGMWAGLYSTGGIREIGEGRGMEKQGGTQELGGPSSASRNEPRPSVVVRFSNPSFHFPPLITLDPNTSSSRNDDDGRRRRQQQQQQRRPRRRWLQQQQH